MSIRMMVGPEKAGQPNVETVLDYPGANGPLYMETTHVGQVVSLGEHNGYDDSDFYAVVWDDAQGKPVEHCYASTRGWTYPNGASVDATPEIAAKYAAYQEAQAAEMRKLRADREARKISRGKVLKVVRGRKVPLGTQGECFWTGRDSYGTLKVGIRTSDRKDATGRYADVAWTAASNCEVVGVAEYA